jgi:hypothetical protein
MDKSCDVFDKLLCTLAFFFCNADFCLLVVVPVKTLLYFRGL